MRRRPSTLLDAFTSSGSDLTLGIREPAFSDIERAALLRTFPLHGHTIVKNVPFLAAANEIAVAAQERYDGSGFPHGLRGEGIPLDARIIGIADAYDGLVSGIEHSPVTPERAVELLCTERRSEFDPRVLNALKILHGQESMPLDADKVSRR